MSKITKKGNHIFVPDRLPILILKEMAWGMRSLPLAKR